MEDNISQTKTYKGMLTPQFINEVAYAIRNTKFKEVNADHGTMLLLMAALEKEHELNDIEFHNMEMDNGGKILDEYIIIKKRKA